MGYRVYFIIFITNYYESFRFPHDPLIIKYKIAADRKMLQNLTCLSMLPV